MTCRPKTKEREDRYFKSAVRRIVVYIPAAPSVHEVRDAAAKAFGVEISDITGKSRWTIDVMARRAAMALSLRFTSESTPHIGRVFGVDHSSVLLAAKRYDDLLDCVIDTPRRPRAERQITKAYTDSIRYETLCGLIEWSGNGDFTHAEDIFPNWTVAARCNRLTALRRIGYAESQIRDGAAYWRVTDAGLQAYRERQRIAA